MNIQELHALTAHPKVGEYRTEMLRRFMAKQQEYLTDLRVGDQMNPEGRKSDIARGQLACMDYVLRTL